MQHENSVLENIRYWKVRYQLTSKRRVIKIISKSCLRFFKVTSQEGAFITTSFSTTVFNSGKIGV